MNKKKETSYTWIYIALIIGMIILAEIPFFQLFDYYGRLESVQLFVILIGTIIMIIYLIGRIFNKPNISELKFETAKLYFTTISNLLIAFYAIFGIAFTILWDSLYSYAIQKGNLNKYIANLKVQGIMLLIFLICSSAIIVFTFLFPLIKQINEKAQH